MGESASRVVMGRTCPTCHFEISEPNLNRGPACPSSRELRMSMTALIQDVVVGGEWDTERRGTDLSWETGHFPPAFRIPYCEEEIKY